jgi:hypothetical protein
MGSGRDDWWRDRQLPRRYDLGSVKELVLVFCRENRGKRGKLCFYKPLGEGERQQAGGWQANVSPRRRACEQEVRLSILTRDL